jgi:hypothetical protein
MDCKYFSSACAEKADKRVMIKQTPEVPPLQNIDHITHSPLNHNIEKVGHPKLGHFYNHVTRKKGISLTACGWCGSIMMYLFCCKVHMGQGSKI